MANDFEKINITHASLFTGIGGFDLAAEWMEWENIFQVELNEFCQQKLTKNFPNVTKYKDIKEFNGTPYAKRIDVLTGGFPCQTFSIAGKGTLDLTLWKEMYRTITEIKPPFIVAENVSGIVSRKGGMAFDIVCTDLENFGYEIQPLNIPVAGKGAPHERERIWFIAYSDSFRCQNEQEKNRQALCNGKRNGAAKEQSGREQQCGLSKSDSNLTNTNGVGKLQQEGSKQIERERISNGAGDIADTTGERFPGLCKSEQQEQLLYAQRRSWEEPWIEVAPRLCGMDARVSNRVDRIMALGNSISPILAFEYFRIIDFCFKEGRKKSF